MIQKAPAKMVASLRFFGAYHKLPLASQPTVWESVSKLMRDPAHPSLNYESIRKAGDPRVRSIRVNDAYRIIVAHPTGSGTYVLLWVDKHDAAYAWAGRHRFETEDELGGLGLVELAEHQEEPDLVEVPVEPAPPPKQGMLHVYSDAQLMQNGVPSELLPALRACQTDEELDRFLERLPSPAVATLILDLWFGAPLREPISAPAEEVRSEEEPEAARDPLDVALERPGSARNFVVISSEEELRLALTYPLELWRVFLHPDQKVIVRGQFDGPTLVSGGAGTGKTVVGLHRARYLAAEVFTEPDDRILLTTFVTNLAENLSVLMDGLCESHQALRPRIEVKHLHSIAAQIRHLAHENFTILKEEGAEQLMGEALRQQNPLNLPISFYLAEWEEVVQERDALTEEAYLQVDRSGRGRPLARRQRAAIWQVFESFRRKVAASGKEEWPSAVRRARQLIESGQVQLSYCYRAVIIDEAQDMGTQEMQLLLALVGQGANSLLLLGDTRQQIYKRGSYVRLLNIPIGRRHMQLRLNYRTTEQIRAAASSVLSGGMALTDEPLGADDSVSLLQGPPPLVSLFASQSEEERAVVAKIQETLALMRPEEVVVVARTNALLARYAQVLSAAGIPNAKIEKGPRGSGVQLATMHRVKGLEFRAVFLVHCSAGVVPQPLRGDTDDAVSRADHEQHERHLLYVTMTRARELLWISSAGALSPLLTRG